MPKGGRRTRNGQYAHKPGSGKRRNSTLHSMEGAATYDLDWTDEELRALYPLPDKPVMTAKPDEVTTKS